MANTVNADILDLLNGTSYTENDSGEVEEYIIQERVPLANDLPEALANRPFSIDITDPVAADSPPIGINRAEATRFLQDQFAHFRITCRTAAVEMSDDAGMELAILRYLCYRNRLIGGGFVPQAYNVRYNDCEVQDPTNAVTTIAIARADAGAAALEAGVIGWCNANQAQINMITRSFANIVCCVAVIFRQKGHHYLNQADYNDAYTSLWRKVHKGAGIFASTWAQRSTLGLHAIMPAILDAYWSSMVAKARVAPPLILRYDVPAAGTAAIFALLVGWQDAKHVYGALLQEHHDIADELEALVIDCKANRWRSGINARFYGANTRRLNLARFSAMAGTIVGVYNAVSAGATLLGSQSLLREASGSPLQQDIARSAARAIKRAFIVGLARGDPNEQ